MPASRGMTTLVYSQLASLAAPLNRGLLSWWLVLPRLSAPRLWTDLAGTSPGTLTNMAYGTATSAWGITRRRGGYGEMRFDGTDDFVSLPNEARYRPTTAFTFAAWAKTSTSAYMRILNPAIGTDTYLGTVVDTACQLFLRVVGSTTVDVLEGTGMNDGAWHHVVGTWDGTTALLYRNGTQRATGSVSGTLTWASAAGTIGGNQSAAEWWNGAIDDCRIYNRALPADEVWRLYHASMQGYPSELQWHRWVWAAGVAPVTTPLVEPCVVYRQAVDRATLF